MASLTEFLKKDIAFVSDFVPTAAGDLDVVEGLENVRGALLRRLLTTPGTIIHRPTYGVDIKSFQNSLNSIQNQRNLAVKIQEQFKEDERVESVLGVQVKIDYLRPDLIEILVRVKIVGYGEAVFAFNPFGDT